MNIKPAVLSATFEDVMHTLFLFEGLSKVIQIDICDGVFGLEETWMPKGFEVLPYGFEYEFDIMVEDWKSCVHNVLKMGAKSIVVHIDTFKEGDLDLLLSMLSSHDVKLGVSTSNDVSVDFLIEIVKYIEKVKADVFVQVMGIEKVGAQGQQFDERVENRIRSLKKIFPTLYIQVDGSMNPDTLKRVQQDGAEGIVVGSYLLHDDDPKKSMEHLKLAMEA